MTEHATNFLGIPIEGDINRQREGKVQRPQVEFEPLVQALLGEPFIASFGWRQRTPYFNDGDPCVFSAFGFWVRTTDDPADEDKEDYEYELDSRHPSLGGKQYSNGYKQPAVYVGEHEAQWQVANNLAEAVEGGEFDHVLLDLFGDHAHVKVTREGITVDFYEHD